MTQTQVPKDFGRGILAAYTAGLAACKSEAASYGSCIQEKLGSVERGSCSKEFAALKNCVKAFVRKQRGKPR